MTTRVTDSRVLVGMFNPEKPTDNTDLTFQPKSFESTIKTKLTPSLARPFATRCSDVAQKCLNASKFSTDPTQALVWVESTNQLYSYNSAKKSYELFSKTDLEKTSIVEKTIECKVAFFKKAFSDYQTLVSSKNPSKKELEKASITFSLTKTALENEMNTATDKINANNVLMTTYLQEICTGDLFSIYNEKEIFKESMKSGENAEESLQAYLNAKEFFTKGKGQYASEKTKHDLLEELFFSFDTALKELSKETQVSLRNTMKPAQRLSLSCDERAFKKPLTPLAFEEKLIEFLFDSSLETPPKALVIAAEYNPDQKARLEEMVALKAECNEKTSPGIPKKIVQTGIKGAYEFYKFAKSLYKGRMQGTDEIIAKALGVNQSWIPELREDELRSATDPRLGVLVHKKGTTRQDVKLRELAAAEIALRIRENAEHALKQTDGSEQGCTYQGHLINAKNEQDRDPVLQYAYHVEVLLNNDLNPRLQQLGVLDQTNPDPKRTNWFTGLVADGASRTVYKNYEGLQEFVDEKAAPACANINQRIPSPTPEDPTSSSALDDLKALRDSLPTFSRTVKVHKREMTTIIPHPQMPKINRLKADIDARFTRLSEAVTGSRGARPIGFQGSYAPTAVELIPLFQTLKRDNANNSELAYVIDTALEAFQSPLIDQQERADHLYSIWSSLRALNEPLTAFNNSMTALTDAQIELDRCEAEREKCNEALFIAEQNLEATATYHWFGTKTIPENQILTNAIERARRALEATRRPLIDAQTTFGQRQATSAELEPAYKTALDLLLNDVTNLNDGQARLKFEEAPPLEQAEENE